MSGRIVDDGIGSIEGRLHKMLGKAEDRIAQLEAALAEKEEEASKAQTLYKKLLAITAGPQFERICYLGAALAVAHAALEEIASVASEKEPGLPTTEAIDDHFYYGMECIRHQHGKIARDALSAIEAVL